MLKPLIRSDLLNRVHFHPANIDYEKFYEECLPKSCLPSDYGGELDSIDQLHKQHRQSLLEMREVFLLEERMFNLEFEGYDFN